jgi:hypothetical protein
MRILNFKKIIKSSLCKEVREEILRLYEKATYKCGETFKFCFDRPVSNSTNSYISKREEILQPKQTKLTESVTRKSITMSN